jgi:hypothetical protein
MRGALKPLFVLLTFLRGGFLYSFSCIRMSGSGAGAYARISTFLREEIMRKGFLSMFLVLESKPVKQNGEKLMKRLIAATAIKVLLLVALILIMPVSAEALEAKLLWEKELPFDVMRIKMANQSGDVLLYSQKARQIILFDKNGNEVFRWGPRIDRQPMGADISDDGSVITYETSWTEKYAFEKRLSGWDTTLHFSTRNGKELWNKKKENIAPDLSPDGTLVAIGGVSFGEGYSGVIMMNSAGEEIWRYKGKNPPKISFSPDSKYIVGTDGDLYVLDARTGELVLKKEKMFAVSARRYFATNGAEYIYSPIDEKVFDKQGNLIITGSARVSDDGNKLRVTVSGNSLIYKLPEMEKINEYPFISGFISSNGRLILAPGEIDKNNSLVVDIENDIRKEIPVEGEKSHVKITSDGSYLTIITEGRKIRYYQIEL